MLLPLILICLGFVLSYITKHGWNRNIFQRPAPGWELIAVRILSIVGIGLALYGIIRLIKAI